MNKLKSLLWERERKEEKKEREKNERERIIFKLIFCLHQPFLSQFFFLSLSLKVLFWFSFHILFCFKECNEGERRKEKEKREIEREKSMWNRMERELSLSLWRKRNIGNRKKEEKVEKERNSDHVEFSSSIYFSSFFLPFSLVFLFLSISLVLSSDSWWTSHWIMR